MAGPQDIRTRRRRSAFAPGVTACAVLLALGALEGGLRLVGRRPWIPPRWEIAVHPDRPFFQADPELGYRLSPGRFEVALRDGEYTFDVTHLETGTRVTGPAPNAAADDAVWIFGCSFTYGWSLNDERTYPWLLRERLGGRPVVNFGVNGYGTVQSLFQFREALRERPRPAVAVLAYSALHDMRNVFARVYRKAIAAPMKSEFGEFRYPYARLEDGALRFHSAEIGFDPPPLLGHSALVNFVERRWTSFELGSLHPAEVTQELIGAFAVEARAAGVSVLLVALDTHPRSRATLEAAARRGVPTADVSLNLRERRFRNEPWDPHPGPLAHRLYAERVEAALEALQSPPASRSGPFS